MHWWQMTYGGRDAAIRPVVIGSPHKRQRSEAVTRGGMRWSCLTSNCLAASPMHETQTHPVLPITRRISIVPHKAQGVCFVMMSSHLLKTTQFNGTV